LGIFLPINPNAYPYIFKHIAVRRYNSIEVFDFKEDESYEIDQEAYSVLKLINSVFTNSEIINSFPIEKQGEVQEALEQYYELNIIGFSDKKLSLNQSDTYKVCNIPEKNPFEQPYLRTLMVNITEKCNLRCDHCYITDKHQTDFPLDKLKSIFEEFYRLQGLKLVLTGGEPFLYSDFKELLEYLRNVPLQKIILSNGVLVEENLDLLDLIKDNIYEFYISVDGLEETHNEIRRANCFQKTIDGIKILIENGLKVSINTMLHKLNLTEFPKLEEFVRSLGLISSWVIDIPTFDDSIPKEVKEKYYVTPKEAKSVFGKFGWGSGFEFEAGNFACGPGIMALDVTGVVTKCGFFTEQNVGYVFELGLKNSWELVQKNLNWCLEDLKCEELGCEYLQTCRGGCRYRAFINTGDILGADQYRCVQFDKKF